MPQCLTIVLLLSLSCIALAEYPSYPPPMFIGLDADPDNCRGFGSDPSVGCGSVCTWLNLVAFRAKLNSMDAARAHVVNRLKTIPTKDMPTLRMPPSLWSALITNITDTPCTFRPQSAEFWAYRACFDGTSDPENHKLILDTETGANNGIRLYNVHAPALGFERFHAHQMLSIFFMWGHGLCQVGTDPDGTQEPLLIPSDCRTVVTPSTPKKLRVIFTGSQGMHSNYLFKQMGYPNAPNCPHSKAPAECDGYFFRLFFPLNETDVLYPTRVPKLDAAGKPEPSGRAEIP